MKAWVIALLSVGAILLQADSFLLDEEFMVKIGRPVN
jgi:hypothetical protein